MIKILKRHPSAQMPVRASELSVGYDLYAFCITSEGRPNNLMLPPRMTRPVPTGLTVVPPPGYSIFVGSRSGMAKDLSVFVTNAPGIVDPDYRGELMVLLYNGGLEAQYIRHGDRVGQMFLLPYQPFELTEVLKFDETERGEKGFGSTGR